MTVRQAYKYRIYPTHAQERSLDEALEGCRHLYNRLLAWRKTSYVETGKSPNYYEQKKALPIWKQDDPELAALPSQVAQEVVKRVDLAFRAFFRRVKAGEKPGYPRFRGQGRYDSLTYPKEGSFKFRDGRLLLSKIGLVRIKLHRPCLGTLKTCTIRRQSGKWYACIVCEVEVEPLPQTGERVGIDVGLESFATLSTGEKIANPRFFKAEEKALAKVQRRMMKRPKGSAARKRARKAVARVHERIRNRRHDFAHQTARRLVNRYDEIAVEDLNIGGMMKNHSLAKGIGDAAWHQFREILTQKAASAARRVTVVDARYTSQDCSNCGHRVKKKLSERVHLCPNCGLVMDRDENAAVNILSRAVGLHGIAA